MISGGTSAFVDVDQTMATERESWSTAKTGNDAGTALTARQKALRVRHTYAQFRLRLRRVNSKMT